MQSYDDRCFRLHVTSETAEQRAEARHACVRALLEPNHSAQVIRQGERGKVIYISRLGWFSCNLWKRYTPAITHCTDILPTDNIFPFLLYRVTVAGVVAHFFVLTAHRILPRVQTLRELQAYKRRRREKSVSDLHAKRVKLRMCPKPLPPARYTPECVSHKNPRRSARMLSLFSRSWRESANASQVGTGTSSCGRNNDPCCIAALLRTSRRDFRNFQTAF